MKTFIFRKRGIMVRGKHFFLVRLLKLIITMKQLKLKRLGYMDYAWKVIAF